MYVIKRIAGNSKGRYMAVGLVNTTPKLSEAHTFEAEDDARLMATQPYEAVVSFEQESQLWLKENI